MNILEFLQLIQSWFRPCPSPRVPPELPPMTSLNCSGCTNLDLLPDFPPIISLNCSGCVSLVRMPEFSILCIYGDPSGRRMVQRMKKTLRQRYTRLAAQRCLKSPAYRELAVAFYKEKQERDRNRLEKWLGNISV